MFTHILDMCLEIQAFGHKIIIEAWKNLTEAMWSQDFDLLANFGI